MTRGWTNSEKLYIISINRMMTEKMTQKMGPTVTERMTQKMGPTTDRENDSEDGSDDYSENDHDERLDVLRTVLHQLRWSDVDEDEEPEDDDLP